LAPVIVTVDPAVPRVGVNPVIETGPTIVKLFVLVMELEGAVSLIFPVVAPVGTVAVICVGEFTMKPALVPLNKTEFVPSNPEPVMTTLEPTVPFTGEKPVICGSTLKLLELKADPEEEITLI
jgi:hypothetical protein